MLATYERFPELRIHQKDICISTLPNKKLQQKIMQVFRGVNCKTLTFEEVANPTVPDCTVIFELGIADANSFTFINDEEAKRVLAALRKATFRVMDFFCVVRYYKEYPSKKKPLKFDYYMVRFVFPEEKMLEVQTFHERGPRYIPPKALVAFLLDTINGTSGKKFLKKFEAKESID
jgi:hypothetical protein